MIETNVPVESTGYVYGGILYERVEPESPQARVGLATCLTQGVLTGSVLMFLFWLLLNSSHRGPGFDYIVFFPLVLTWGVFAGLVEGLVIWLCTRVAGHNLQWFTRALIGALVPAIPYFLMLALALPNSYGPLNLTPYVIAFIIPGAIGAILGLFTGSRLDAWSELVRGVDSVPHNAWFLTGLTGFVLRLAIIFFLMESILAITVVLQSENLGIDSVSFVLLLLHFGAAFLIVFARLTFWKVLPLAIIINFTLAAYMVDLLKVVPVVFFYLYVGYLSAWGLFLISRCPQTYKALAVLKEEIRYYLID